MSGTTLTATVDATPHWTTTYHWTIDKSVTPDTWDLFHGDSGTSQYNITVTKDQGTTEAYINGSVCVTNGGSEATDGLNIVIELRDGIPPPNDLIATATVDVSAHPVLQPGETYCYPYTINIPAANIHAGGTYKITANVTILNHSGSIGIPFGPSPSATTTFPSSPTLVNDEIHVDDTNGQMFTFTDSGSETYLKTFTCADEGVNTNTATIRETGQSDSASVTVNCYSLEVSKDAATAFNRTFTWSIDKVGNTTELTLFPGQQAVVAYSITINTVGYTDSDYTVQGTISVHNPAPMSATINSVSDVISGFGAVTVVSRVTFPYTLASGATLQCTYSATLPDNTSRTNTANATLQNYDYDYQKVATADGTTDFNGTADVDFGNAAINNIDECIDVSDTFAGFLGTVCAGDTLPKTFTYTRTVGPYTTTGCFYVNNTASFVTNDNGVTGEDSWSVKVCVVGEGKICGYKFYDKNLNGSWDSGEPGIQGWKVQLINSTGAVINTTYTASDGKYCFDHLAPGTYTVTEIFPSSPTYVATTVTSYTVTITDGETICGNNFGNVCLLPGSGGFTMGYWTNKNGQALITLADINILNQLNLYKPPGVSYPPFSSTLATGKTQIKSYLLNANAVDMRYMLSAQLIATELDVRHGLSGSTIIYVGQSAYVPSGFITINDAMANANAALLGNDRKAQEYWKNVLDGINNNHWKFLCPKPCYPLVYP